MYRVCSSKCGKGPSYFREISTQTDPEAVKITIDSSTDPVACAFRYLDKIVNECTVRRNEHPAQRGRGLARGRKVLPKRRIIIHSNKVVRPGIKKMAPVTINLCTQQTIDLCTQQTSLPSQPVLETLSTRLPPPPMEKDDVLPSSSRPPHTEMDNVLPSSSRPPPMEMDDVLQSSSRQLEPPLLAAADDVPSARLSPPPVFEDISEDEWNNVVIPSSQISLFSESDLWG